MGGNPASLHSVQNTFTVQRRVTNAALFGFNNLPRFETPDCILDEQRRAPRCDYGASDGMFWQEPVRLKTGLLSRPYLQQATRDRKFVGVQYWPVSS